MRPFAARKTPWSGRVETTSTKCVAIREQKAHNIQMKPIGAVMLTLSALLLENGLPNLPVLLIEPHRNPGGVWRIKFSYETGEPLSMSADQAATMAAALHEIGESELADE